MKKPFFIVYLTVLIILVISSCSFIIRPKKDDKQDVVTYDSNIQRITVNDKDNLSNLSSSERDTILHNTLNNNSYTNFSISNKQIFQKTTPKTIEYKGEYNGVEYRTTISINENGKKYSILENNNLILSDELPLYIVKNISALIQENNYKNYVYDKNRDVFVCVYNKNNPQTGDGRFLYKKIFIKDGLAYKIIVAFNPDFLNDSQNLEYINNFKRKYGEEAKIGKEYEILELNTNIKPETSNNSNLEFININGKQDNRISVSESNNNIIVDTGDDQGDLYLVISNTGITKEKAPNIKGYDNDLLSNYTNRSFNLNENRILNTNNKDINNNNYFYDEVIKADISSIKIQDNNNLNRSIMLNTTSLQPEKSKYANINVGDSITLHTGDYPDTPGLWVYEGKNPNNPYKKVNVTLREKRTVSTKFGDKTLLIFVEDDMWEAKGAKIDETFVKSQADEFLRNGLDNDIYDYMTSVFNTEWSDFSSDLDRNIVNQLNNQTQRNTKHGLFIDNYDEIVLLYADIFGQGERSKEGGVVGYYSENNNYINEFARGTSNEAIILTLNAYFCKVNPEKSLSTLAHELQHAIHFHHREAKKGYSISNTGSVSFNNTSSTWINEMCSSLAEEIIAKKIEISGPGYNDKDTGNYSDSNLSNGRIVEYIGASKYDVTDWDNVSVIHPLYPYGLVYSLGGYLLRNINTDFIKNIYSSDLLEDGGTEKQRDFLVKVINSSNNSNYTWSDILRMWGASVLMSDNYFAPNNYVYSIENSNNDYWFKDLFDTQFYIPSNNYFAYKNDNSSLIREMWSGGNALSTTGPYIYNSQADRPYSYFVNNDINPNTNTFVLLEKGVSGKKVYNIDVSDFNTSKLKFTFVKK